MRRPIYCSLAVLLCVVLNLGVVSAAGPFDAPAQFVLTDSTIDFAISMETKRFGTQSVGLNPNPAQATGAIVVNTLSKDNGYFQGRIENITASTTATIDKLNQSFTVKVTLNDEHLDGWFLWGKEKVILNPGALKVTLCFDAQCWNIPTQEFHLPATYKDETITITGNFDFSDTYLGNSFSVSIGLNLKAVLDKSTQKGSPWIALKTDKGNYQSGDKQMLLVSFGNNGVTEVVDIYVVLLDPSGNLFMWPTYTTDFVPVIEDYTLPKGTYVPYVLIQEATLPAVTPPIEFEGIYYYLAAFFRANTYDLLGDVAVAEFQYQKAYNTQYPFDGYWEGTAVNQADSDECANGRLFITIKNGQFVMEESEAVEEIDGEEYSYQISGSVNQDGNIVDGTMWEDYKGVWYEMGHFTGKFEGNTASGQWHDSYGCHGTFTLQKNES